MHVANPARGYFSTRLKGWISWGTHLEDRWLLTWQHVRQGGAHAHYIYRTICASSSNVLATHMPCERGKLLVRHLQMVWIITLDSFSLLMQALATLHYERTLKNIITFSSMQYAHVGPFAPKAQVQLWDAPGRKMKVYGSLGARCPKHQWFHQLLL